MNCLYSVRDTCDDLILREVNESDASAFARQVGCCPSQVWSVVWFLISCAYFGSCILYVLIDCVQVIILFTTLASDQKAHDILHVST